ncbi:unnamed protein product (macronuclear) [Paramecium tetraurelia]|uniref:Protein kinase domain-containing protein n=1 Tax=Paramecium tetraurelia TaxID=5888 RepID=A0CPY7_PARTE|nr:uncharacterized protein GSPATT00038811001 [Paramecium tetraurelia]CAK72854.1 unnamed protein product [Paramecium tetraurelia]|eukprot:XP_001440251.1 hypothetical protein (macronuclear) [Paramecium tetraurelia strain d4-2]
MNNNTDFIEYPFSKQYSKTYETITIDRKIYKIFKPPIGCGQEGIVYQGQDVQTNEIVAIKEYKQIEQNELKALQAIQRNNQTHIIKIIGVDKQQNGQPIVVMDFVHGEFYQFMLTQKYQNLSYEEKNGFFFQMMKGVEQLHQLGFFHRDVKPENFVYINGPTNEMTIKLIDFGLVKENKENSAYTNINGTPFYMAPEVSEEGNRLFNKPNARRQNTSYDKSIDICSLGAIWYELLTQDTFFQGNSQEEIFDKIQTIKQEDINRQIENNNNIKAKEKHFMKQMLQIIPSQRLQLKEILEFYGTQQKMEYQQEQIYDGMKQYKDEELKQKLKRKEIQELKDLKQFLLYQLENIQSTNKIIVKNLTDKLNIINEINSQDRKKQELLNYINDELQKHKEIILKTEQRLNLIQYEQTIEKFKEYNELIQENEQYQNYQMIIFQKIVQEQDLLEKQVKDQEQLDDQSKQQELLTELEQKLQKEKQQYQSQLKIQQIQEGIIFYQTIQIQIEEKIQDVIKSHQQIPQDIQTVKFQEKTIQQYESLQQQIAIYQSCNSKFEEIQQAQNRLKAQIEEANKCILKMDKEYLHKHQQQIEESNKKLIDYQQKYQYFSTNQKYANQITQIINQIGQTFDYLDNLKQLISQRTLPSYQQYTQIHSQIQQSLKSFEKYHTQLHQQIYDDQQIELKNQERIKTIKITEYQLDQFNQKMNQFKDQLKNLIKNEYCNNEKSQNLINTRLSKIDQNTMQQQELFVKLSQLNQLESCDVVNRQIKQLEEFQGNLKEVEVNEIEYINQLELIIKNVGEENKSQQEKDILTLNNQLQTRYSKYQKALQSIQFQFQSVEFYQQMNQNKENLQKELKYEIKILEENPQICDQNMQLFEEKKISRGIKNVSQKQQEVNFRKNG